MKILITGSPGVGKTTISKLIAEKFNIKHVELSRYIKDNQLYESYDKDFDTCIFDEDIVQESLVEHLKGVDSFVVDTHSPECVSFIEFDKIFILKLESDILFKRLKQRGYNDKKIKENINCEIFGVVEESVEEIFGEDYFLVGDSEGCITQKAMLKQLKEFTKDI
ncbi:Adenylate kinase isoenzyme 6 [Nosema granulosis]|uniref:Adenylate kinase isoenzyme 6 homolog n=1 Tax=Nosema granulosis TaxID=83296 RepID=A0A9P6KZR0_9MICR|nr:Adenylate kinase isoenzyme 6 [Nosema granulosis]